LYVYFAFGVVLFGFGDIAWGYIWWMMDCMHSNTVVDREQNWKRMANKIKIEVPVAPLTFKVVLSSTLDVVLREPNDEIAKEMKRPTTTEYVCYSSPSKLNAIELYLMTN
jgi:hypothetical protein